MTAPKIFGGERTWRAHLPHIAIFVLVLAVSIVVRIRLLDAPLERDEGEHGYIAQTLLAGYAPWQLAYNLKLPGTDAMYAIFMAALGQTAVAIRVGLLVVNVATIFLTAVLGKRLFGIAGGLVAGTSYALLSCSQGVLGTVAHSTHFVVFFAVTATIVLLKSGDNALLVFLSGLIYGIAFLMKQPGIAFGAFGALFVLWRSIGRARKADITFRRGLAQLLAFNLGVALPYALLCLALWRAGTFGRFWHWTVTLARAYASNVQLSDEPSYLMHYLPRITGPDIFLWVLAAMGLLLACLYSPTRRAGLFTGALVLFSFLAVSAGGVFNPHYFILMLPALALANGAWVAAGYGIIGRVVEKMPDGGARIARSVPLLSSGALLCFGLACLYSIAMQRDYLFQMSTDQFERASYGLNPFPEAVKVAEYIRSHSDAGARIAVLGSEAEIYFYSHRQAATGYLFTYGVMETHSYALQDQLEMIREIESARPQYIVFVGCATSWLVRPGSSMEIFRWKDDYTRRHYEIVGAINLEPGEPTKYVWGSEAHIYDEAAPVYLTVYRRR